MKDSSCSTLKYLTSGLGLWLVDWKERYSNEVLDIVYAQLHPQLWLPKRFKMALFLSSDSPDVEFYRTHAISMFEKRIPVSEVDELKDIEFDDDTAKMLFNYDACGSDKERQKLLKEWKQNLRAAAVSALEPPQLCVHQSDELPRNASYYLYMYTHSIVQYASYQSKKCFSIKYKPQNASCSFQAKGCWFEAPMSIVA